ncbi:YdcF family protein [Patescibacteria group bacterium]|nr:YdcF family protein [Patescibacteria group bacterium]
MQSESVKKITNFIFKETKIPKKVDLIFVLGNDFEEQMKDVFELYKKRVSDKILISGFGDTDVTKSEASIFKEYGISLGIPENVFILEEHASNTKQNIQFSIPILKKEINLEKLNSILFVCKAFHTQRVFMTARKFLPKNIKLFFYPIIDERNITKNNWYKNENSKFIVLNELKNIGEYSLTENISIN